MRGINNNYSYGFGNISRRWQPKRQRLMVGRDIAPVHKEAPKEKTSSVILADSVKLLEAAQSEYSRAADTTRLGFSLKGDIKVSPEKTDGDNVIRQEQLLAEGGSESIYLVQNGGKAMLRISGAGEERLIELKPGEDLRISWNKDGSAEVFSGAAALTGGKLAAQGDNDILLRMSAVDVQAGVGSTVLNLSSERGGNFSGGHNVRYLGGYSGASIEGGTGLTKFEGYFGDSKITSTKGAGEFSGVFNGAAPGSFIKSGTHNDIFSGHFALVTVSDEGGENTFSGTFMSGSSIQGGSGNDNYNGRFFDCKISDIGGNNSFGTYIDMKRKVQADFVRTVIEAGDGNDKFIGTAEDSTINLGAGNDEVDGVLLASTLNVGDGNDKLRLLYATGSFIELGAGDDDLHLVTGSGNSVSLGAGDDKMTSGMNADGVAKYGTIGAFTKSAFLKESSLGIDHKFGHHFGDVQTTEIDASEGENHIAVHDGLNVHSVRSGKNEEENVSAGAEAFPAAPPEALIGEDDTEATGDNRFLTAAIGGWLPNPAGNSVVIMDGNGESISFDTMKRVLFNFQEPEEKSPLRAALRKYRKFGGINSN